MSPWSRVMLCLIRFLHKGSLGSPYTLSFPQAVCHTFCFWCSYCGPQRLRDLPRVEEPVSDWAGIWSQAHLILKHLRSHNWKLMLGFLSPFFSLSFLFVRLVLLYTQGSLELMTPSPQLLKHWDSRCVLPLLANDSFCLMAQSCAFVSWTLVIFPWGETVGKRHGVSWLYHWKGLILDQRSADGFCYCAWEGNPADLWLSRSWLPRIQPMTWPLGVSRQLAVRTVSSSVLVMRWLHAVLVQTPSCKWPTFILQSLWKPFTHPVSC